MSKVKKISFELNYNLAPDAELPEIIIDGRKVGIVQVLEILVNTVNELIEATNPSSKEKS